MLKRIGSEYAQTRRTHNILQTRRPQPDIKHWATNVTLRCLWAFSSSGFSQNLLQWLNKAPWAILLAGIVALSLTWSLNAMTVSKLSFIPQPSDLVGPPSPIGPPSPEGPPSPINVIEYATVTGSSIASSGRLQLRPTACIHGIELNGHALRASHWCSPLYYKLDISPYFDDQPIVIRLGLSDDDKADILPMYSSNALFAMLVFGTIAIAALRTSLIRNVAILRRVDSGPIGRMCKISFFPLMAMAFIAFTQAVYHPGPVWIEDHSPVHLSVIIMASNLLFNVLDNNPDEPIPLSISTGFVVIWLVALYGCFWGLSVQGFNAPGPLAAGFAGSISGFFALVPVKHFYHRAKYALRPVIIAIIAAICPAAYWYSNLPFWMHSSPLTVKAVMILLKIANIPVTMTEELRLNHQDKPYDYFVHLSSPAFDIGIGSYCDGLEGVFLFFCLISAVTLLNWQIFSRVKHLWAVYLMAIPFVLFVNVLRIVGIVLYVEQVITDRPGSAASVAVEAFHSNVGWMLYFAAFVVFLSIFSHFVPKETP